MSTIGFSYKDNVSNIPESSEMRFGIVVCEWNNNITYPLLESITKTLIENGTKETNITIKEVPGCFELIYGCAQMIKYGFVDAIIAIGCVIKGDTPHFDYICSGATQGLTILNTTSNIPVINGILTVNNLAQAEERIGLNNSQTDKGKEFALTAIKMVDYAWQIQK